MKPYYDANGVTIYHGDARYVHTVVTDGDLIVTSPPYNARKNYGDACADDLSVSDYLAFLEAFMQSAAGALKPAARCVLNLPWIVGSKPKVWVPYHLVPALAETWYFRDMLTWVKGSLDAPQHSSAAWGTWLSPSGPALRAASEPCLIFCNGPTARGLGRIDGTGMGRCEPGDITKAEWMAWTVNTWAISPVSNPEHPAPFPLELPHRFIKLYTWPGDTVIDPFMGTGTTLWAAKRLGRKAIGIDSNERYCDMAANQLSQGMMELA